MGEEKVKHQLKLENQMPLSDNLMDEFNEYQRMNMIWVWLLMGLGTAIVVGMTIYQIWTGIPVGSNPAPDAVLIGVSVMMMGMLTLFSKMNLQTTITSERIKMKYFPFGSKNITWDEVESAEVINYGFVGYGMRLTSKYGTVYNTAGKYGLLIKLKSGKKFTIGTQRKEDMEEFLNDIGRGLG